MLDVDLGNNKNRNLLVKNVIPKDMFERNYDDGWGNPIHCMTDGTIMYVWSRGPNQVDDNRNGDDLVIEFRIYEKLNPDYLYK